MAKAMLLNHAEKNNLHETDRKTDADPPPTISWTPAGPISPKSTKRGEPEPRGPRTTIPHIPNPRGIRREPLPGDL